MKDIFVLLVLLNAQTTKVFSQPYQSDSDGNCRNSSREYLSEDSYLCCKKCRPGQRLKQECSASTESVCETCPPGQAIEDWNYSRNCFSCKRCKTTKGLQEIQHCTPTTKSKCGCQPGMFCILGFEDPYCEACRKYKQCGAGYGVSVPGKANSDVTCQRCPDGTFSDTVSYVDHCVPHTKCQGGVVLRRGNATSDNVCGPVASTEGHADTAFTTASTIMSTTSSPKTPTSNSKVLHEPTDSTPGGLLVSGTGFNHSTKSPLPRKSDGKLVIGAIIGVIIGLIVLLSIIIALLFFCKTTWRKDTGNFKPKVDANGNCETGGEQINQRSVGGTQPTSLTETSPEQQYLLEKGEASSNQSQCSNNTEPSTRTDGCSSDESIGPLRSTIDLHNPQSALSQPMTLLSNTEPATPQTSLPTQSSSHPTSPQIINPITANPQVNVNIHVHIGNGSAGTSSVMPTDLIQTDSTLPFGEEEESFSIPQQEAGKQSLTSVQESASCSA